MWKRTRMIAITAIGITIALTVAGCASGGSSPSGTGKSDVQIDAVQFGSSLPFQQQEAAGMKDAASALGAKISFSGPPLPDATAQLTALQQVIATQPDGILSQPLVASQFTRPIKDAQAAGVQVVQYQAPLASDSTVTTFVGPDDVALGRAGGDAVVKAVTAAFGADTNGHILTAECIPGITQLDYRLKGFEEEIKKGLPNVTIDSPITSANDSTTSYSILKPAVDGASDLVSVYSPCEADTQALAKIHAEENAKWFTVGHDIDPVTVQGVKDGNILALYPMSAYAHGYLAAYILAKSLQTGVPAPQGWIPEPEVVVDSSTVDSIGDPLTNIDQMAAFWKPYLDKILAEPDYGVQPLNQAAN